MEARRGSSAGSATARSACATSAAPRARSRSIGCRCAPPAHAAGRRGRMWRSGRRGPSSSGSGEASRCAAPCAGAPGEVERSAMTRTGLVLGAGGIVGQAFHAGVLAALEQDVGWDPRSAEIIVGSSAGSVTGATLRLGVAASDLAARAEGRPVSRAGRGLLRGRRRRRRGPPVPVRSTDLAQRVAPAVARAAGPHDPPPVGGPAERHRRHPAARGALRPAGAHRRCSTSSGPAGRPGLWICAARQDDGRRVVFGRDGSPFARLSEAVAASCAIPSYFAPVPIGRRHYIDGGVHSATNADVLVHAGLDVVIVVSPDVGRPRHEPRGRRRPCAGRCTAASSARSGGCGRRAPRSCGSSPARPRLAVMGLNAMAEDRSAEVAARGRARTPSPMPRRRAPRAGCSPSPRPGRAPPDHRGRVPWTDAPSSSTRPASADYERGREPTHRDAAEAFGAATAGGHRRRPRLGTGLVHRPPSGVRSSPSTVPLAMVRRTREVAPRRPRRPGRPPRPPVPARRAGRRVGPQHLRPPARRGCPARARRPAPHRSPTGHPSSSPCSGATDEGRGIFPDDDFPDRWFSTWTDERLHDVIHGAGFTLDELELRRPARRAGLPRLHDARPHAPGHGRRRDAPARERPEPQPARGGRGGRLRDRRQPVLAGGARGRAGVAGPRPPARAPPPRRRHDRPGEAGDAPRRRPHPRRVPGRRGAPRPAVRVAAARRRVHRRPGRVARRRRSARHRRMARATAGRAARVRHAVDQRAERRHPAGGAGRRTSEAAATGT